MNTSSLSQTDQIQALLDEVEDEAWLFDTELLYRAQQRRPSDDPQQHTSHHAGSRTRIAA